MKTGRQDKEAKKRAKEDAQKGSIAFGLGRKKTDFDDGLSLYAPSIRPERRSPALRWRSLAALSHGRSSNAGSSPLEVTTKKSLLTFELTKKKVPRADVMNFTRQLAVFMKAGIPIMEALEVIVEETQNKFRQPSYVN